MVKETVGICFKEHTKQYKTYTCDIWKAYFFYVAEGSAYIYPWALKD